jgi:hypothetical protein
MMFLGKRLPRLDKKFFEALGSRAARASARIMAGWILGPTSARESMIIQSPRIVKPIKSPHEARRQRLANWTHVSLGIAPQDGHGAVGDGQTAFWPPVSCGDTPEDGNQAANGQDGRVGQGQG